MYDGLYGQNILIIIIIIIINRDGGRYNLPAIWTRLVSSHVT